MITNCSRRDAPVITFGSVCSGIEAASLAWDRYDWRASFLSEIESAPISVLKYRHHAWDARRRYEQPERVALAPMLWGDFSALRIRHLRRFGIAMPDVLAGGTPCQAFSVAGKRLSLDDPRGNLSLAFVKLAHAVDKEREREGKPGLVVVWENVPGCLTTKDNAFGCLLAGFVGADDPCLAPRKRGQQHISWPDAGLVAGPRAWAAWRVLDAQYFGLAQRRRRVLLVVGFRDALDPGAILFERAGVPGDSPPRRKTRQDVAGTLSARTQGGGGLGTDFDLAGGHVAGGLSASTGGADDNDAEQSRLGEGFDASEDGSGRGTPIVPVAYAMRNDAGWDGEAKTPSADADGRMRLRNPGFNVMEELAPTLDTGAAHSVAYTLEARSEVQAIAFGSKDYGGDALEELSPTLRAGGHSDSHANAGVPPAVAINLRGREGGSMPELDELASLRAADGGSSRSYVQQWAVRRLMPIECERLQGSPDDYTLVPHRGKPMADGPRYKMIGNSWAVPKFAWLGARIDAALRISLDQRLAA